VPETAGDFTISNAIHVFRWLTPMGRLLIFPLLMNDSPTGWYCSIAFDAGLFAVIAFLVPALTPRRG
jgi:hypothetical protein